MTSKSCASICFIGDVYFYNSDPSNLRMYSFSTVLLKLGNHLQLIILQSDIVMRFKVICLVSFLLSIFISVAVVVVVN